MMSKETRHPATCDTGWPWAQEHLAQVSRAATDVTANQIGIVPLHILRPHHRTRGNAVPKAGSKAFHLFFDRLCHVAGKTVWHMAITPRRMLPAGAREGSNKLACVNKTYGRSETFPATAAVPTRKSHPACPPDAQSRLVRTQLPAMGRAGAKPNPAYKRLGHT